MLFLNQLQLLLVKPPSAILILDQQRLGAILLGLHVHIALVCVPAAVIKRELGLIIVHAVANILGVLNGVGVVIAGCHLRKRGSGPAPVTVHFHIQNESARPRDRLGKIPTRSDSWAPSEGSA